MERSVMSRTQANELVTKMEKAGCFNIEAHAVIISKGNKIARTLVKVIRASEWTDSGILDAIEHLMKVKCPDSIFLTTMREAYEGEQVYPKKYKGPKPINEQITALAEILNLDPTQALAYAKHLPALPDGAEGSFVRPSVDAIATKHFPGVEGAAERYCYAARLLSQEIAALRPVRTNNDTQLNPKQLRLHAHSAAMLKQIAETQPGDIHVIPAQLGRWHIGEPISWTRNHYMCGEFGLDVVFAFSVALIHPERFAGRKELAMRLPGNEHSIGSFDSFENSVAIFFDHENKFCFGSTRPDEPNDDGGSATGFLV